MSGHLSIRARTVVTCIGLRQRAKGVQHLLTEYRRTGDPHDLALAHHHARQLRERAEQARLGARLVQAGVIPKRGR